MQPPFAVLKLLASHRTRWRVLIFDDRPRLYVEMDTQVIRVEKIEIQPGAQAIVGNVTR